MQKQKLHLIVLLGVLFFSFLSCRPVFELMGLAESVFVFVTEDKKDQIPLRYSDSARPISLRMVFSKSMTWSRQPRFYISSIDVGTVRPDSIEDITVTQCLNKISYKDNASHRKILYLFNRGYMDFWDKIPENIEKPTYATLEYPNEYQEYDSLDLVPMEFKKSDKGWPRIIFVYYDIPQEADSLKYYIKLGVVHKGSTFSADTSLDLHKIYREIPIHGH